MGSYTAVLDMKLRDLVSANAAKVEHALSRLDRTAKKVQRNGALGGAVPGAGQAGGGPGILAAGGNWMMATAAAYAGYKGAELVETSYKANADLQRQITRILITAEAGDEAAARVKKTIREVARENALALPDVVGGLEALVAAGRTLPEAMSFLPTVSRTATASGAAVDDLAKSADALGLQFGISGDQMGTAFDMMAKAGKLGKFELKDMAHYWASISAMAGSKGFKGLDGLKELLSIAQVVRQGVGTSEEAASSLMDMMAKISMTETTNKFKKFGIDVPKEIKKVRDKGGNELLAMAALIEIAMRKGAKIDELFGDRQAQLGWLAFFNGIKRRAEMVKEIANSAGTIAADHKRITHDAAAAAQNLANSWEHTKQALGGAMDSFGATRALNEFADGLTHAAEGMDNFIQRIKDKGWREGIADWLEYQKKVMDEKGERIPDAVMAEYAKRGEMEGIVKGHPAMIAQRKSVLDRFTSANKGRKLSPEVQAKYDQRLKELRDMEAKYFDAWWYLNGPKMPEYPTGAPPMPSSPSGPHPRNRFQGRQTAINAPEMGPPQKQEVPMFVLLDDASLTDSVIKAKTKAQAILDANPVRVRVQADVPSYDMGRKVTNGVNGALGDPGKGR